MKGNKQAVLCIFIIRRHNSPIIRVKEVNIESYY